MDVMPIFMIIALDIVITLCFSINCSSVICSPTLIFSILRDASSETYGPRVYFPSYKFPSYNFSFLFTFFAIFYFSFHKPKIPKILLYRLSIYTRSHFANNREGIDGGFPSPEPRTDSRSALSRKNRAWRRLRLVDRDNSFSLIFFWKYVIL